MSANAWKIHRVDLHNFKSYSGHVSIGPFKDFTCIVGPNGSGKSNLMDALSFVVSTTQTSAMRGRRAADFVNRRARKAECSVSIVLRHGDKEATFTRSVDAAGAVAVAVNGRAVSEAEFAAALERHRVGARVNNFLVFQHEVEAVARTRAGELTALLERVSGSGELRRDYEAKRAALEAANAALSAASVEKRDATVAANQTRLARKNAEQFEELRGQRAGRLRDAALVELFGIETDLERQKDELAAFHARLCELQKGVAGEQGVREMKKRYAELHRGYLEELKRSRRAADDMRTKHNTMERIQAALEHLRRRQETQQAELTRLRATETVRTREMARLEEQLRRQVAALEAFEKLSRAADGGGTLEERLSPEQLAEYRALRREADCATVTLRQQRDTVARQRDSLAEALKQCERAGEIQRQQRAGLQQSRARTAAYVQELETRLAEQRAGLAEAQRSLTQSQEALAALQERGRERDRELARVQEQLYELRHLKESDRQRGRAADALESLRTLFGVRGRLVDLCAVPNERHRTAVAVTLGRNLEAIVVDTTEVAVGCVRYLKEQRLPPMTFLPLDSLQSKPVDDRLRTFGGSCLPVLDVVRCDADVEPAVLFAVGQTLLCDTLEEAKRVAYGSASGERFKVVTVDGTMLLKNGSVQGGLASAQSRAHKWDEKKFNDLVATRDRLIGEGVSGGGEAELARARIAIRDLESRIQFIGNRVRVLETEIGSARAKEAAAQAEEQKLADGERALETRRGRYAGELEGVDKQLAGQADAIAAAETLVFADFVKRTGIANLLELEREQGRRAQEHAAKRQELQVLIHRLEASLEMETKRVGGAVSKDAEEAFARLTKEIASVVKDHNSYKAIVAKAQASLEEIKASVARSREELEKCEKDIREAARNSEAEMNRLAIARKGATALQAACDTLRQRRLNTVRRCEMEEIELPLKAPPGAAAGSSAGVGSKRGRASDTTRAGATHLTCSEAFSLAAESQGSSDKEAAALVCIDFSGLPDSLVHVATDKKKLQAYRQETETVVEQLGAKLEELAPNMKAASRLVASEDRLGAVASQLEQAREKARKAQAEFMAVKNLRTERFLNTYEKIAASVDQVYKQLTIGTRAHAVSGSAYLSLENMDEPFLGGTTYHATPPLKQFMPMELLSGGERTMAALALLFAIHAVSPTPFFVLDEVDAALDAGNVEKLAHYLRSNSGSCQFIVVSLKDQLYHMADMLIGVMKNKEEESSNVITMDLRGYPY